MAVSQEKLAKILQHNAATLCSEQSQKVIGQVAKGGGSSYQGDDPWGGYGLDTYRNEKATPAMAPGSVDMEAYENSTMPQSIKESLLKDPIDLSPLYDAVQGKTAFLDKIPTQHQSRPQQVNEQRSYSQIMSQQNTPQQAYAPAATVDYSIIKMIVSECIKDYFSNNQLNEGTLKQIGISKGKITLVDTKGNVFSAKLEKEGNLSGE